MPCKVFVAANVRMFLVNDANHTARCRGEAPYEEKAQHPGNQTQCIKSLWKTHDANPDGGLEHKSDGGGLAELKGQTGISLANDTRSRYTNLAVTIPHP